MLKCRRNPSNDLYICYLDRWKSFCLERQLDPIFSDVCHVLEFLQCLFQDTDVARGSSAICTARSALSSIVILPDGTKVGENKFVKQFIKGVCNMKPAKPRYLDSWDPNIVLEMFKNEEWNPLDQLTLMELSVKTVMLILLATYQRGQIILALNLERMTMLKDEVRFEILRADLKQGSKKNCKPKPIVFCKRIDTPELCIFEHLQCYLSRTLAVRNDVKQVFLITRKPFNAVSRECVSKWVKAVMKHAKIDVEYFAPGSTRGASSSQAYAAGIPVQDILDKAGWSRIDTFLKWYQR